MMVVRGQERHAGDRSQSNASECNDVVIECHVKLNPVGWTGNKKVKACTNYSQTTLAIKSLTVTGKTDTRAHGS